MKIKAKIKYGVTFTKVFLILLFRVFWNSTEKYYFCTVLS